MTKIKRLTALFLAVVCFASVLTVCSSAIETVYRSYDKKYGYVAPVKDNLKTLCKEYKFNNPQGVLNFKFKSKGYSKNVFFGITIYSDKEMQNIIYNTGDTFPATNAVGSISLNFSSLPSGEYHGICYTFVYKNNKYAVDEDSIYTYTIKVNKIGDYVPKITEASALYSGNFISWKSVEYADSYIIYRKTPDTSWKKLAETEEKSYLDTSAIRGTRYSYTVKAVENGYKSTCNKSGVELCYLPYPVLEEALVLSDNRIKLSWLPVEGADSYRVYRKAPGESSYTRIATLSNATEYTDAEKKTATAEYSYKIKAFSGTISGTVSPAINVSVMGISKCEPYFDKDKITVRWNEPQDATGYTLFRKVSKGEWETLISNESICEYTDTDIESGKKYTYSLVVHKGDKTSSFDSKGTSVVTLTEPRIKSIGNSKADSVLIKWDEVYGAKKYNVYRRTVSGEFEYIGTTENEYYYDKSQKTNNIYYEYYVEAESKNGISLSGNNTKRVHYMAAPDVTSLKWDGDGYCLKWKRVSGATSYKVYRKAPGGSYKLIAEVPMNVYTFVDTAAKKKDKYYYIVKSVNGKTAGAYENGKATF